MTCKINADTTDGLKLISDTSGEVDIQDNGTTRVTVGDNVDIHGNELILDADGDTSITADTDDQIDFKTSGADRVTINSSGVGVNTTSPQAPVHIIDGAGAVSGAAYRTTTPLVLENNANTELQFFSGSSSDAQIRFGDGDSNFAGAIEYQHDNNDMAFYCNSSEHMRINEDGKIGISVPSISTVQMGMRINGQSWFAVWEDDSGTDKFRVASSGNVQNTNNSYGAISDQKLKENIVDTSNKLEDLKRVQIKNYNFIGDSQKQIGVIAQELETVFPSMVENHPDLDEDGNDLGTVTKSVKYSVFVPILIKSLQEQQAIIESLEARITALESE